METPKFREIKWCVQSPIVWKGPEWNSHLSRLSLNCDHQPWSSLKWTLASSLISYDLPETSSLLHLPVNLDVKDWRTHRLLFHLLTPGFLHIVHEAAWVLGHLVTTSASGWALHSTLTSFLAVTDKLHGSKSSFLFYSLALLCIHGPLSFVCGYAKRPLMAVSPSHLQSFSIFALYGFPSEAFIHASTITPSFRLPRTLATLMSCCSLYSILTSPHPSAALHTILPGEWHVVSSCLLCFPSSVTSSATSTILCHSLELSGWR